MDLTVVTTLLGSIKTATEIAKLIKDSDVSLEKAETKLKLADLITALADAKIEVSEVQQALLDKDTEIRALQEQLKIKAQLKWEKPYYWLIDGTQKDGPFCQHCYDKGREFIRLQDNGGGCWDCKVCKNVYTDSTYKGTQVRGIRRGRDPYGDF
ncbi:hypothetical protein JW964_27120 [candidate division KSB1 bacterium]|nr:hypothetical protein [candidate division KSB1 bacterium]